MRCELHAEWTKLRTSPATGWLLLAVVAVTVVLSTATAALVTCPSSGCGHDATRISLTGVQVSQALVAVLAALTISSEHTTGMIRTSITAMPRRVRILAAKAIVLTGPTLAAGAIGVVGAVVAAGRLLPGNGFTSAHGYGPLSLADGSTLRAVAGSVLYLVLIALLSLGIATAVRDAATAIGVVLSLLYLVPIIALLISDPQWQRLLRQISPTNAGLTIQVTTDVSSLPISPWAGMGVLAGWTAAALLGGNLMLRRRDA
ncbi:ABC transporter permease [Jiangella muralis]|uniref:ABC transporter permease n=1 Tax=Jiangella muralis TaxID=702383 RepID=UPI00069FE3AC|nr:ABC transporter permease [Jiangella muralis]